MNTHKEFEGPTALVTGSSNGIGAETAVKFAERGALVLIQYNQAWEQAEKVLERVREASSDGEIRQADLRHRQGVADFLDWLRTRPVDILVNNAGSLVKRTRFLDFMEALWEQVFMLNLHSAMRITGAAPHDRTEAGIRGEHQLGSSRNGGGLGATAYTSAKAALSAMNKGLAKEFSPLGIRVNGVSPGTVDTNYHRTFSTA